MIGAFFAGAGALLFAELGVIFVAELVGRYRFGTLTRRQMRARAELRASILMRAP